MKRYIRCSDDSNAYSKWYDMMEIADPNKLDEYAEDDEYIVNLCEDNGLEYAGWIIAKPEYRDCLFPEGLDALLLARGWGNNKVAYEVVLDRMFPVEPSDIEYMLDSCEYGD